MLKNKNLPVIISVISVLIMIIWGTLAHSYRYAWLAVFTGGILIASIGLYNKCGGLNYKSLPAIIPMWSVLVMFIWAAAAGSYNHAWLAVFAGGVIGFCINMFGKGKAGQEAADKEDTESQ